MPNGYTDKVYSGKDTSFQGYLLRCARAFLVGQRDDPDGVPPRIIEVDAYYTKSVAEAEAEVLKYTDMSVSQAVREQLNEKAASDKRRADSAQERAAVAQRYTDLINEIDDWDAGAELADLKSFMVEQLFKCLKWDCEGFDLPSVKLSDGEEYLREKREYAKRHLEYARQRLTDQKEYVANNNSFVAALYAFVNFG